MKMMLKQIVVLSLFLGIFVNIAFAKGDIRKEEVSYSDNGVTLKGMVVYDADIEGERPAIVVVPEWWGNNEYARMRATMLAELGYIAIAADMYGDGKIANDPKEAMAYSDPFYKDPSLGKSRIEAAIRKVLEYPEADPDNVAAIGYCFGGSMVLNAAKMGTPLKGVVSFHGGLKIAPAAKGSVTGKILVCHGAADKFVSEEDVKEFRGNLDEAGVDYKFIVYPNATHAFTNPDATASGKKFKLPIEYNAAADKKSWADMKSFFEGLF